jgi:beta-glucosidase
MSTLWPPAAKLENPELEKQAWTLLDQMSLEQKVGQMIQPDIRNTTPRKAAEFHIGSVLSGGGSPPYDHKRASVNEWVDLADEYYDAALSAGEPLPIAWGIDAVHGHNNLFGATLFQHNIGLGAARNPDLVREVAAATAAEVAVTGLDWTFAPTLAVARDARWGRTYESYSESTSLVQSYAGPSVEGLQGRMMEKDFLQGHHVIATAKHFLGDGGTDKGIDQGDTLCDEGTLFDIHGRPYVSAIEAGVQVIMASFSSWQGNKLHGHRYLLQEVLKDRMGFDGFVISDWNGHGQLAAASNVSGDEAINAGIDMLMAPEDWHGLLQNTLEKVRKGVIKIERVNDAVLRILRVKLRAGLRFPNKPSKRKMAGRAEIIGCEAHLEVARRAVRESAVLLKNDNNLLPISKDKNIMVCGPGADNISIQSGGWSLSWQGDGSTNDDFPGSTSIFAAIKQAVDSGAGFAELCSDVERVDEFDVAIVVYGEMPYSEGHGDRQHLSYSSANPHDIALLRKLEGKIPVISIFLSGRPLWVNPELNASDAFVAAWLPGSEARGLTDLLFSSGEVDFVGKLPFSWPKTPQQSPLNESDIDYDPLFPFGYGLNLKTICKLSTIFSEVDATVVERPESDLSIFNVRPIPPFDMYVGDEGDWHSRVTGRNFLTMNRTVEVQTIDWQRQEDARRVSWHGGSGQLFFLANKGVDCSKLLLQASHLVITLCVHAAPKSRVMLRMESGYPNCAEMDITALLCVQPAEEWLTVYIDLSALTSSRLKLSSITTPFLLWTEGKFDVSIGSIGIENSGNLVAA